MAVVWNLLAEEGGHKAVVLQPGSLPVAYSALDGRFEGTAAESLGDDRHLPSPGAPQGHIPVLPESIPYGTYTTSGIRALAGKSAVCLTRHG